MENLLNKYRSIMEQEGLDRRVIDTFIFYLKQVLTGETGYITKKNIKPPQEDKLVPYQQLNQEHKNNFDKLVVVKLNGGLGTGMGLEKAKSLIEVKNGLNFLDIIARQNLALREKSGHKVPLLFMNSFNTDKDTLDYLDKYPALELHGIPLSFKQHKYPRVRKDDFYPYQNPDNEMKNWNPPGHGDIYQAMHVSGVLDKLLDNNIEYAFISNADNLAAVVDAKILNYMVDNEVPFLMEVCVRQEIDKKGGHLAQTDKGLILREIAQCPDDELSGFQDINRYSYFNTNNIWINLREMKKRIDDKNFVLPLILNSKTVDGTNVYQIESAMGAAIGKFPQSKALIAPRQRFAPVKKTNDLLTIRSDAYILTNDYSNVLNPDCKQIPYVSLDEKYYKSVKQLEKRIPGKIPSLKECIALKIEGNITFGDDVALKGKISLKAKEPVKLEKLTIEAVND